MKLQSRLAILLLALHGAACAAPLSASDMQEDLRFLRDTWSHEDRTLDDTERRAFDEVVDGAAARSNSLSPSGFALEVARAVATANNGHSTANIDAYLH